MRRRDRPDEGRIEEIVLRIQKVYLTLAILGILGTLSSIFGQSNLREISEYFVFLILLWIIYFGLRRRRSWIIPLVLIMSAYSCIRVLFVIFQPADDIIMLLSKILGVLLFFFFAYQINFFRKPQVRLLFGAKGHELF